MLGTVEIGSPELGPDSVIEAVASVMTGPSTARAPHVGDDDGLPRGYEIADLHKHGREGSQAHSRCLSF